MSPNIKIFVIVILIAAFILRQVIRRQKRKVSLNSEYKYEYELEIGLSNMETIILNVYSDYRYHNCESVFDNCKHIRCDYQNIYINEYGRKITIPKSEVSFERLTLKN